MGSRTIDAGTGSQSGFVWAPWYSTAASARVAACGVTDHADVGGPRVVRFTVEIKPAIWGTTVPAVPPCCSNG